MNSFKNVGYGGPQPPSGTGTHTYEFLFFEYDHAVKKENLMKSLGSEFTNPKNPYYFSDLYNFFSRKAGYNNRHEIGHVSLNYKK